MWVILLTVFLWYDNGMKSIIVAYDKKRGIGAENDLLWQRSLPADLRHFKETTLGGAIIMGRKTFDSIGRVLPGRQNIVVSRNPDLQIAGARVVASLKAAYSAVEVGREAFIIGGAQIYTQAMDSVDQIYATEVDAEFSQADTFFPAIDTTVWSEVSREHHAADEKNKYDYDFVVYRRR